VRAQLEGTELDKSKTKRKKDGVFYTPKYITKYIVDNTVGKLCEEKKAEIGIDEAEFAKDRKGRKTDTLKKLDAQLKLYRDWLLQLTICDPACGSGAFLNQALEFLMGEHRYVDELEAQLLGYAFEFPGVEAHILEHNIYGVDINEESVEIARLSLWLRTAKKGRKLSSLSSNIKCGNSLIDDPKVAGDLAFDWKKEFVKVFEKGGFDVVIGNPPYVRQELLGKVDKAFFSTEYKLVYTGSADLYVFFYQKAISLLKSGGLLGFITPNKFIRANYGKGLRNFLSNSSIKIIIDFGELPVFADAATFPCVLICNNTSPNKDLSSKYLQVKSLEDLSLNQLVQTEGVLLSSSAFQTEEWKLSSVKQSGILDKMRQVGIELEVQLNQKIKYGIKTGFNEAYIIDNTIREELVREHISSEELIKPFVVGDDVRHYRIHHNGKFILLVKSGTDISKYPAILKHLNRYKDSLEKRYDKGASWFDLRACDYYDDFVAQKIIYPVIAKESRFALDQTGEYYFNDKAFMIPNGSESLLAILNSKLVWFYLKNVCSVLGDPDQGGRLELRRIYLSKLPVVLPSIKVEPVLRNASCLIGKQIKSQVELVDVFLSLLQSQFELPHLSTKLQQWPSLDFKGFIAELGKAKVVLSLEKQEEWMAYFTKKKTEANALQNEIDRIDKEIDQLVYQLYGLSLEEIAIVENA